MANAPKRHDETIRRDGLSIAQSNYQLGMIIYTLVAAMVATLIYQNTGDTRVLYWLVIMTALSVVCTIIFQRRQKVSPFDKTSRTATRDSLFQIGLILPHSVIFAYTWPLAPPH